MNISVKMPNVGWLFYKDYYSHNASIGGKGSYKLNNEKIFRLSLPHNYSPESLTNLKTITLETTYPGLLIGSGYTHESGEKDNDECKIGFFFDYTSGLPVIPGSSVKGMLRSSFPGQEKRVPIKEAKTLYIYNLIKGLDEKKITPEIKNQVEKLEMEIFEGKTFTGTLNEKGEKQYVPKSIYERDIFFDALIERSNHKNKLIFGNDYITPHGSDMLKNPIPLQFMKVLPRVVFRFQFKLGKSEFPDVDKVKLFKQLLKDSGIGAKTNVGYGQFK